MTSLVVGATGKLGGEICRLLAMSGESVRALVRESSNPDRVEMLRTLRADIITGDLKSRPTLDAACSKVHAVFTTASALGSQHPEDSLDLVDRLGQRSLIDAAVAAGVERFVYISVLGLINNYAFARAKLGVEQYLRESGLTYSILQPTVYMDDWLTPELGFDFPNGKVVVYGDGTNKLAWVLSADVAQVAVAAAKEPSLANATIPVTGPDLLSPNEVIAIFEEVAGEKYEVTYVSTEELEAQRASASNPVEESFAGIFLRYAAGDPPEQAQPGRGFSMQRTSVWEFAKRSVERSRSNN